MSGPAPVTTVPGRNSSGLIPRCWAHGEHASSVSDQPLQKPTYIEELEQKLVAAGVDPSQLEEVVDES